MILNFTFNILLFSIIVTVELRFYYSIKDESVWPSFSPVKTASS